MSRKSPSGTPQLLNIRLPIGSSANSTYDNPSYNDLDSRLKSIPQSSTLKNPTSASKPATANSAKKDRVSSGTKGASQAKNPIKQKDQNISQNISPAKRATLADRKSQANQDQSATPKAAAKKNSVIVPEPEVLKVNTEPTAEEARERLYKVFQYYTSIVEHGNVIYLKAHRFSKMMIDAEIRSDELNQGSLDLLYAGELRRSGNLDFEKFLKLLARIAKVKYGKMSLAAAQDMTINVTSSDNKESWQRILKEHMFPLYVKIFEGACTHEEESVSQATIEGDTNQILGMVSSNLEDLYKKYFSFEMQSINDPIARRQKMENSFFSFIRDLSICPDLMTKGTAYSIWQDVLRTTDNAEAGDKTFDQNASKISTKSKAGKSGKNAVTFTFEQFKTFLIRVANYGFKDFESQAAQSQRSQFIDGATPQGMGFFHQSFSLAGTPANRQTAGFGQLTQQISQSQFGSPINQVSYMGTPAHQMSHFGTPANRQNQVSRFLGAQGTPRVMNVAQKGNMSINEKAKRAIPAGDSGMQRTWSQNSGFFTQGLATGQSGINQTFTNAEYKISQAERAVLLLEKMDTALRVLNPEKKGATVGGGKSSMLINQDAMNKISHYLVNGKDGNGLEAHNKQQKPTTTAGVNYGIYNITDEEVIKLFTKYGQNLHKIFQHYASYSQPLNTTKLNAGKFHKLLSEAGLTQALRDINGHFYSFRILHDVPLTPISASKNIATSDADIVIATLTGPKQINEVNKEKIHFDPLVSSPFIGEYISLYKNSPLDLAVQNRLEFDAFLKAIEMISAKLYPELALSKAVNRVLEKNILKLEKEIDQIQKNQGSKPLKALVDLLQDPELVEFLAVTHKAVMLYYRFYADSKGMMNIEKFMQFCKDFQIFPYLISKSKLCALFRALVGVRTQAQESDAILNFLDGNDEVQQSERKKSKNNEDEGLIDEHMFVEALAVCAVEIPYLSPQPTDVVKVFNFLDKLNRSQGPSIVRRQLGNTRAVGGMSWDIMHEVRKNYPEFFVKEEKPLSDQEAEKLIQEKLNAGK